MTSVKINYISPNPIKAIEWEFDDEVGEALLDADGDLNIRMGGDFVYISAADFQAFAEALLKMARQGVDNG